MSADDFIASIEEFGSLTAAVQTDLLALYLLTEGGASEVSAQSLDSLRGALHLAPYARGAVYLSEQTRRKAGRPGRYVRKGAGYVLERGYSETLKATYLGRPTAKKTASALRGTLSAVGDPAVRVYLEEAVECFERDLYRSAVIMGWCVSYGLLRAWVFKSHLAQFNGVTSKWKVPVTISNLDDFQELTEGKVLDTLRTAGLLTKEQIKVLKQLLDQRNSYAHPTMRAISPAIAEAYLDAVVSDVVPHFA